MIEKPVILIIMDGWGLREETEHNAVFEAKTPNVDGLTKKYPYTTIGASGGSVGLPEGQM